MIGNGDSSAERSGGADVRSRWEGVLRSFAEALDHHRSLLLAVQPDGFAPAPDVPFAFLPPADLPPCPPELASRLRALQLETDGLVELARTTLAELKPVTAPHTMRAPDHADSTSTVDTRL